LISSAVSTRSFAPTAIAILAHQRRHRCRSATPYFRRTWSQATPPARLSHDLHLKGFAIRSQRCFSVILPFRVPTYFRRDLISTFGFPHFCSFPPPLPIVVRPPLLHWRHELKMHLLRPAPWPSVQPGPLRIPGASGTWRRRSSPALVFRTLAAKADLQFPPQPACTASYPPGSLIQGRHAALDQAVLTLKRRRLLTKSRPSSRATMRLPVDPSPCVRAIASFQFPPGCFRILQPPIWFTTSPSRLTTFQLFPVHVSAALPQTAPSCWTNASDSSK